MRGKHRVVVSTKRLRYDFVLRRNLTIVRGNSATGKTTLVDMIQEYVNNPSGSPVQLICDKVCYVLSGTLWKEQLLGIRDSIVFIDEGNEFVKTDDFAREIQRTDNYYVIVSREGLSSLPYSVEEIYGIRTSGKYGTLKQSYHEFYRIYGQDVLQNEVKPEMVITEDSNSGYQFFRSICNDHGLKCDTAHGKSNVFHYLNINKDENVLVIADGAAFGPEIDKVLHLLRERENAALYLPESFEWLILSSGVLKDSEIRKIINEPSDFIESMEYFSWERFFTVILTEKTKGTYLAYAKRALNPIYLEEDIKASILKQMDKIMLDWKASGDHKQKLP
ncbi:translation initiation factor 2 [Candidatus Merdisoma sp. JLR.KK006]|uniref:translation initiation factor 2 n=1 Tax=Candidatus Merdisoma sp. JLR.KK006 TaxID=3112626 RepID=UPI002FF38CA8